MHHTETDLAKRRFPWAMGRFDIFGLVAAIACFLVGALLGVFWGPLFMLGLMVGAVVLMASRHAERTPPPDAGAIVSPVDGVLVSVTTGMAPAELRLATRDMTCLRIASSPASTNTIHAPIAGEITSLIEEAGDTSTRFASDPDAAGLASAYVTVTAPGTQVGFRVATGGLGPRLDIHGESGDPVRLGRVIGVRRLGGWCDVWLDPDLPLAVWPGMSLTAAETRLVLADRDDEASPVPTGRGKAITPEPASAGTEPFEMPDMAAEEEADEPPATTASEQFERLRRRVQAVSKDEAED